MVQRFVIFEWQGKMNQLVPWFQIMASVYIEQLKAACDADTAHMAGNFKQERRSAKRALRLRRLWNAAREKFAESGFNEEA